MFVMFQNDGKKVIVIRDLIGTVDEYVDEQKLIDAKINKTTVEIPQKSLITLKSGRTIIADSPIAHIWAELSVPSRDK